ncbi:ABC transporter permease [Sporolactobacillus pectinivorans]|uniref:ABC transporter permease n=1 Tax=Sporolactobacillus pectinivorans TaxID=1591408 RepID=UPI001962244E|nr:ABC transporter permease subunit [Sporolactobacillus pectinivorans]
MENDSLYVKGATRLSERQAGRAYFASLAIAITLIVQLVVPKSEALLTKSFPWYTDLLIAALIITLVLATYHTLFGGLQKFVYKSYFIGASFLAVGLYNFVTLKLALLQPIFFPSPEAILNVLVTDWPFLLECLAYSARLLAIGLLIGTVTGLATGVLIGWYTKWNYWVDPIVKLLGPIPSTAFIPIALSAFATSFQASVFLIALSTWFPVTVLTNSGVANVKKTFLEVADTLGATDLQKIFRVAVPSALPNIFVGIFNGTCSSFITLMTAEMIGVKYGIGWYINWQRQILAYANVYAGLIVIAISFSLIITLLFKVRDYFLRWQKGIIKW